MNRPRCRVGGRSAPGMLPIVLLSILVPTPACLDGEADHDVGLGDASPDADGGGAADVLPEADESASADCDALRHALSLDVRRGPSMGCTGVLRLDYVTLDPLGYAIFCEDVTTVTETDARGTAMHDLSLEALPGGGEPGELISDPSSVVVHNGDELFVFYRSPVDAGHVAVVNARNNLTVFGGSIVHGGTGIILYPGAWESPAALGRSCTDAAVSFSPIRSFDLRSSEHAAVADPDAVMAAAMSTVLPGALRDGTAAYLKNAMVLLYARTVGEFDPAGAEYIVIMNAGWE